MAPLDWYIIYGVMVIGSRAFFRRKILGDLSEWTIQLGMTRRHSHSFFGRKVKVEKIIRHEMYNNGPVQHDHDIALFKVYNTYAYNTLPTV